MTDDFQQRFGGIARLYGRAALERFARSHVVIVGVGGVGSWVTEALARTGIGALTLIDLDDVCLTNVNRQLPAMDGTVGKPKVVVLAERVHLIAPECRVSAVAEFLTEVNCDRLLAPHPPISCVVDCVDRMSIKCLMIRHCLGQGIPIVTVGGAGGRRDPTKIRSADLNRTEGDRLLKQVRRKLRQEGWLKPNGKKKCGVLAIFSDEPQVFPQSDGTCAATPEHGTALKMDCASGYGAATFVTGAFAFAAAAEVIKLL